MTKFKFFVVACFVSIIGFTQGLKGTEADIEQIRNNSKLFSEAVVKADYNAIGAFYTEDAKIFPPQKDIISGNEAIKSYWTPQQGVSILSHSSTSSEIKIMGDEAYDYGYYEGKSKTGIGKVVPFKGKYLIIWRKVNGEWKMYLDIWNRLGE